MTAILIATGPQYTFGALTNRMTSGMVSANAQLERLHAAIATASAGYTGTPGTEFEVANAMGGPMQTNLFGVVADSDAPGQRGSDYSYAMGRLHELWTTFWAEAEAYVQQLDNGTPSF
jgi:hypothetical protein